MSWRDDTPPSVQGDLDLLADEALTAATKLLARQRGELYPFGVRLPLDGEPEVLHVDPSEGEGAQPAPDAVMDMLYESGTMMREGTRGVAFVSLVDTSNGDAVRVELEHCDGGPALVLLLPFRTRRLRRAVETGELEAQAGERRIWTRPAAPVADLGPGRRDGPARPAAHRRRPRGLLLRSAEPLAAWHQREHQRAPAQLLPRGPRPPPPQPRRPRRRGCGAEHAAAQDPRLQDARRSARQVPGNNGRHLNQTPGAARARARPSPLRPALRA